MSDASMATSVPGADGDPEVGLDEGGGVVDAVADHGDHPALALQAGDLGRLGAGEDAREERSMPT